MLKGCSLSPFHFLEASGQMVSCCGHATLSVCVLFQSHTSFSRKVAQATYAQRFNSKIITGDLKQPEADEDSREKTKYTKCVKMQACHAER